MTARILLIPGKTRGHRLHNCPKQLSLMETGWTNHIPLRFQGGVAAPSTKSSRSLKAQTGWLLNSIKIRCASRSSTRWLRDLLRTTPPSRSNVLIARTPLLANGGECDWSNQFPWVKSVLDSTGHRPRLQFALTSTRAACCYSASESLPSDAVPAFPPAWPS